MLSYLIYHKEKEIFSLSRLRVMNSTMYPRMNTLFLYFDCWGFCTQFNSHSNYQKTERIYLGLHLILGTVATVLMTNCLFRPFYDKLGRSNDILKIYAYVFVYWISLLELYYQRRNLKKFWSIVQNIDTQFWDHRNLQFKMYNLKFIAFTILVTLMFINYVKVNFDNNKVMLLVQFWFWHAYVGIFRINQILYYSFFVDFIKNELKVMDGELSEALCENCIFGNEQIFSKESCTSRFKRFRHFYGLVYDLCCVVNTVFSLANFVAIVVSFLLIVTEFNWFYWRILNYFYYNTIGNKDFRIEIIPIKLLYISLLLISLIAIF